MYLSIVRMETWRSPLAVFLSISTDLDILLESVKQNRYAAKRIMSSPFRCHRSSTLRISLFNRTRTSIPVINFRGLLKDAERVLRREGKISRHAPLLIDVTFIDDAGMRALNRKVYGKDRTTDVISLSYLESFEDHFCGEIFISLPYAKRQAKKIGQSLRDEIKFLFSHGLLHIFGYDHKKPHEEKKMLKLTYEILGRIAQNNSP